MESIKTAPRFLQGGGEMGDLVRGFDWSQTLLGPPGQWPQSLQTTVGIVLHSAFPMFLFWGEELISFYNDAFRPSLGIDGKHPSIGKKGKEVWPEIWEFIGPLIDQVMTTGTPVWFEDQSVPFYRNGQMEEIFWTFSYSPAYGDDGAINGVLVVCNETTEKVKNFKQLGESKNQLQFAIEAAELGTWDIDPVANTIKGNDRLKDIFGLRPEEEITYASILDTIPANERDRVEKAVKNVFQFSSGGIYNVEHSTIHPVTKKERIISAKGRTWFDDKQVAIRFNGTMQDVTEQTLARKKIEKSEAQFRNFIAESVIATAVLSGRTFIIDLANNAILELWGRDGSVIGKPLLEVMPELIGQPYLQLLETVFNTGKMYSQEAALVYLNRNGRMDKLYRDFSYKPLLDEHNNVESVLVMVVDVTDKVVVQAKLKESEQRYRTLIEEGTVATALYTGADMRIQYVNETMLRYWGKTDSVIGKTFREALPELKDQPFPDLIDAVYSTGKTYAGKEEKAYLVIDGVLQPSYYNFTYKALHRDDGTVYGIHHTAIDVTEQVLARKKAEDSAQKVRAIVDSAPFPIAVYSGTEMRVELANQAIMDIWGKGNDVTGKLFTDVLPELGNQEVFEQISGVFNSGVAFHTRNQRLDLIVNGQSRSYWFNYSFTPLFDTSGKVYGVMNTGVDNTDIALAKQKVEESERNIRNTILKAPVAMCIFRGRQHVVEIANDRMIELWGRTAGDVMGKPIFEGLPEAKDQGFEQLLDKVFHTGESFTAQDLPITLPRNGKIEDVYVNFVYEAFREPNGSISGIIAVATDVTAQFIARKKIEEVVAYRTKELATANSNLEKSNAELAQFAYIASHDLQEPVRKVGTFAQMLEQSLSGIDERSKKYLDKINTATSRMTALIRDVLAYSQLSKEKEIFKPVDLQQIIDGIIGDFELLIEQKQAMIHYSGLPVINAIPLQMSQLFSNLISNSLKFCRDEVSPVISISASILPAEEIARYALPDINIQYYNIEFRDNGIGFKQEHAEQIFNIFQRLHGKTEYAGTGIGLAMCKKIAQNHHGEIYATGSTGHGAIFNVILPKSI